MKQIQSLSASMRVAVIHLSLMAFEGLFVAAALLAEPSQSGGFLGFSFGRWAILFINLLALAVALYVLFKVWTNQAGKPGTWLSSERNLFRLFFLCAILFGFSLPAALGEVPAIRDFTYFGRIRPSLIWLALASGQVWLTLLFVLRKSILLWFRQFFPIDRKESFPFTKNQRLAMLGIALIYLLLQFGSHLQVREAEWLPDSIDYIFPATTYNWNEPGLWTHTKPWGAAVLYKLTGSSPSTIDAVQTALSALAWLALAWVFSRIIHKRRLSVATFALILGFSLAPSVQMWNHIIQSESLSISLMVLIIAVWMSLLQKWRGWKLLALILLFAWWIGARDTNVYLSLMIAGILALVGLFYKQQRFYWGVSVLLVFFCYINIQISEAPTFPRWLYPLTNTLLHRILPEEEFLRYFEARGLPVSPALLDLSGGFANSSGFAIFNNRALDGVEDWLYRKGKDTYIHFLLDHPIYTLTSPWKNADLLLVTKGLQSYAPERYKPVQGWLFGTLFFPNSLWLAALLALTTLVITLTRKPWQDSPGFWLILVTLALFFPHFYLVWHGDAAEVGRHAIQSSVQLRLSLWLLLLLALDTGYIKNVMMPR